MSRHLALAPLDTCDPAPAGPLATLETPETVWAATAPLLAGIPRVRLAVQRRGGVEYRARDERPLTDRLPGQPAAVRVYGHDGACATLFLDLDASRGGIEQVRREAAAVTAWLAECGARVIEDVSPNGGRHLYLPLANRLEQTAARELVEALALLFPTVDANPHRSARSGCIRTPGSRHPSGGHQKLITPLATAYDVLRRRNPDNVVRAMRARLAPQIATWRAAQQPQPLPDAIPTDGTGRELSTRITAIAREGRYDQTRYRSPSEARMAVLTAAARAGWQLADVVARLEDGRWPGLAGMYEAKVPGTAARRHRIAQDWRNATAFIAAQQKTTSNDQGVRHVRTSNTSLPKSHGGYPTLASPNDHAYVRTWTTALLTHELPRLTGHGLSLRWLARAIAEAAHKCGSRFIEFGVRSLAIATGCDHTTVAAGLKTLARLGWIEQTDLAQGTRADQYVLTIPNDLQGRVEHLRWHSGHIHAKRPAFRELGDVAGLVFEALEHGARTITELIIATGCSRSAITIAVNELLAYNAIERTPAGLIPHPDRLARIAEDLGALDAQATQIRAYAQHRRAWLAYLTRHQRPPVSGMEVTGGTYGEYWLPPPYLELKPDMPPISLTSPRCNYSISCAAPPNRISHRLGAPSIGL